MHKRVRNIFVDAGFNCRIYRSVADMDRYREIDGAIHRIQAQRRYSSRIVIWLQIVLRPGGCHNW